MQHYVRLELHALGRCQVRGTHLSREQEPCPIRDHQLKSSPRNQNVFRFSNFCNPCKHPNCAATWSFAYASEYIDNSWQPEVNEMVALLGSPVVLRFRPQRAGRGEQLPIPRTRECFTGSF